MARRSESFKRPKSRFKPEPRVLIICEDSKSGLSYLEEARHYFHVDVHVDISHCGKTDPNGIVEEALKRVAGFDQVYCVIDRDNHENFNKAIELAKTSNKVEVVASYPCYEFWLLLHFGYCRKPYTAVGDKSAADYLIEDLRKFPTMAEYDKKGTEKIFALLLGDKFNQARKFAPKVLADACADGNFNPSTRLHILIDTFEKLSKPQLLA